MYQTDLRETQWQYIQKVLHIQERKRKHDLADSSSNCDKSEQRCIKDFRGCVKAEFFSMSFVYFILYQFDKIICIYLQICPFKDILPD
ncbi:hypothetical protein EZS27_019659 [termite gut metagenome]|uniref:Uncharacterized protein n=1 Tax=termite gut metagenome TaxID=433724 RepID=A0A5J4RFU6_9ZZZZ